MAASPTTNLRRQRVDIDDVRAQMLRHVTSTYAPLTGNAAIEVHARAIEDKSARLRLTVGTRTSDSLLPGEQAPRDGPLLNSEAAARSAAKEYASSELWADTLLATSRQALITSFERGTDIASAVAHVTTKKPRAFGYVTTCAQCCGHGALRCGGCGGHGSVTCGTCFGHRNVSCGSCHGSGQQPPMNGSPSHTPCMGCGGSGRTFCTRCNGSGTLWCSGCGGSGEVACGRCETTGRTTVHVRVAGTCTPGTANEAERAARDVPRAFSAEVGDARRTGIYEITITCELRVETFELVITDAHGVTQTLEQRGRSVSMPRDGMESFYGSLLEVPARRFMRAGSVRAEARIARDIPLLADGLMDIAGNEDPLLASGLPPKLERRITRNLKRVRGVTRGAARRVYLWVIVLTVICDYAILDLGYWSTTIEITSSFVSEALLGESDPNTLVTWICRIVIALTTLRVTSLLAMRLVYWHQSRVYARAARRIAKALGEDVPDAAFPEQREHRDTVIALIGWLCIGGYFLQSSYPGFCAMASDIIRELLSR